MLKAQQLAVWSWKPEDLGFSRRTYLRRLHFSWQDYLLTILSLAMTLILVVFSYY
jgi:energy-coupling factor transporter transmembrane protein EcfT